MDQKVRESLFSAVGQYLLESDLNLDPVNDAGYVGTMSGEQMSWKIVVRVDDESELHRVVVCSYFPVKTPSQTRGSMAELFARLNGDPCDWRLGLGHG